MPRPAWVLLLLFSLVSLVAGCAAPPEEAPGFASQGQALGALEIPLLLGDLAPGTADSILFNLTHVDGTLYFVREPRNGLHELWRSDGTADGTYRIKELMTLCGNKPPWAMTLMKGTLYFLACGQHTVELWKSDGTEAGTVRLKELYPGGDAAQLTHIDGKLYLLLASYFGNGILWTSDGTEAGTVLLKSTPSRTFLSKYVDGVAMNGAFYFIGDDTSSGLELWKSDGTAAGTVLLKDICPGADGSAPSSLEAVNGTLFFSAMDCATSGRELWKSDGTAAGTVPVRDLRPGFSSSSPGHLTSVGGKLYFVADDGTSGPELWTSDGSAAGTVLVKDLRPGSAGSNPTSLTGLGGVLFFVADDGTSGPELWRSDGSASGTVLVKDLRPGAMGSNPTGLRASGTLLFFVADDGTHGAELWKSTGTAAGTTLVRDVRPGVHGARIQFQVGVGGSLFFVAHDGAHGQELWTSDGTGPGTRMISDLSFQPASSEATRGVSVNGAVFFAANDGSGDGEHGLELWKSDGTPAGTVLVKDITPGPASTEIEELVSMGGALYFSAGELWKSDGTSAGTVLVKDIGGATRDSHPRRFTQVGGMLYFAASEPGTAEELWKSDGTSAGTVLVKDISPGAGSGQPERLTNVGGTLYFVASDQAAGAELWKSDGTSAGTVLVKDLCPGSCHSYLESLTDVNGTLFFLREGATFLDRQLWKSDGTAAGTVLVKALPSRASPEFLTSMNGTLYFVARDPARGQQVWKSDGTEAGTVIVTDINPNGGGAGISWLTSLKGTLVFFNGGLWKSDGTAEGTTLFKAVCAGGCGQQSPVVPVEAAGGLYFVVNERSHGSELWRTDGTEAGTFRVADLNPGAGSAFSAGDQVVSTGKSLFFVADDGQKGREPWGLPFAPIRCPPSVFIEATNPSADLASYPAATPTPGVATLPPVSYSHASGSAFPFGSTVVTATASDPAWPASGCTFTVTVGDSTPPQLQCLGEVWVEAASSQGAVVTYPPAMATDLISTPTITYEPPSGSVLHLGANGVTLTATDAAGNASSCTFDVEVVDTTPPRIQCPGDRVVEATSFPTTQVSYPPATVSDAVGSTSGPYYSVLSDSPFPLGETKVTVSASDWRGNGGSCSFTVSVRDTQPPRIQCPADVTIQAATSQGTHIYLREPAQGTDNLAPPVVSYTPDMTQLYPVGTREVTAIATDVGGNTASCTFNVTVEPPATPDAPASCGCQPDSPGGVSPWWLLTLVAFVHQRVLSRSRARSG